MVVARPAARPPRTPLNQSDPFSPRKAGGDAAGRGGPPRRGAAEPRSIIPAPLRHSRPAPSLLPRSVIPAPPIPGPLRHSCPPPSFLRRQESSRSTQARTQPPIPTALNRPLDPPAQNALHKPAPLRHSCPPPLRHSCPTPSFLRRQESSRSTQARTQQPTPTALNRPLDPPAKSALHKPPPAPSFLPPPPSFLRRQESSRATQPRTQPPTPTALNRPRDPPAKSALHKPAPLSPRSAGGDVTK